MLDKHWNETYRFYLVVGKSWGLFREPWSLIAKSDAFFCYCNCVRRFRLSIFFRFKNSIGAGSWRCFLRHFAFINNFISDGISLRSKKLCASCCWILCPVNLSLILCRSWNECLFLTDFLNKCGSLKFILFITDWRNQVFVCWFRVVAFESKNWFMKRVINHIFHSQLTSVFRHKILLNFLLPLCYGFVLLTRYPQRRQWNAFWTIFHDSTQASLSHLRLLYFV